MVETKLLPPTELILLKFRDIKPAPGMYSLGGDALGSFAFGLDWGEFKEECTLGEALNRLRGASPRELDFMQVQNPKCDTYTSGAHDVKVEADSDHLRILRELIELTRKGVKPREATWFYYDSDSEKRLFFVVSSGIIVEDCYTFLNDHPLVLGEGMAEFDFGWSGHPGFENAFERYWYRKFYTETLAGQLCVLSSNETTLYHYDRETSADRQDPTPELLVRVSCVVLPILAAIAFPLLRLYFAALSVVFAGPWIYSCWRILNESSLKK